MNSKNIKKIEYIIVSACILFISFIVFPLTFHRVANKVYDHDIAIDYNDGWSVQSLGMVKENISLPYNMNAVKTNQVIISKNLPATTKGYNCIAVRSKRQDITVYIDSVVRASYTDRFTRNFGNSSANMTLFVPIYNNDAGKELRIRYSSFSTDSPGNIAGIYIGTEKGLILNMVRQNIIAVIIGAILLLIALFCLILYFLVKAEMHYDIDIIYLFWFSLIFGVWILAQSEMRQLYLSNLSLASDVGYMCMLFMAIPLLFYINSVLHEKYTLLYVIVSSMHIINAFTQITLQHLDLIDYGLMIKFTHLLIFVDLFVIFVAFIIEIFINKTKGLWVFFVAHIILSFCGLSEIYTAVKYNAEANGRMFCIGMLSFVGINVTYTATTIIKEAQKRRNAIAENKAKSNFLATMSHEIRTPINSVLGMNEMILRESKEKNILEYSSTISNASHSLLSLVNDILDFSKIEEGKLDIIDVNYVLGFTLRDLVNMLSKRAEEKGLQLFIDIDENLPTEYLGDEIRVKQVLSNLLTNAIKYTDKGSISLVVREDHRQAEDIWIYFEVKDTGKGIKSEDLSTIGSSFSRYDLINNRSIEGTGLGLSITKQLLELMGSELMVESEYSKGSSFSFILKQKIIDKSPMEDIYNTGSNIKKANDVTLYAPDAKILVVDDNKTNLFVIEKLLNQTGIQVTTVTSGLLAIECVKNTPFDIVLMDHMMPDMDGIETYKKIKEMQLSSCNNTKFVALTANAVSGAKNLYLDNGFAEYLTKPIEFWELQECIYKLLPPKLIKDKAGTDSLEDDSAMDIPLNTDQIKGDQAMQFCGNDFITYKAVMESYYNDATKLLDKAKENNKILFDTKDLKETAITAHTFKSLSKTIGANGLSDMFLEIETAAKNDEEKIIIEKETTLKECFEIVVSQIGKYLSNE